MIESLGWGALAASSLVVGAGLALVRTWSAVVVGLVLAFAAGALIASVLLKMLIDSMVHTGPCVAQQDRTRWTHEQSWRR